MIKMQNLKKYIITAILVVLVLLGAFFAGGKTENSGSENMPTATPVLHTEENRSETGIKENPEPEKASVDKEEVAPEPEPIKEPEGETKYETVTDKYDDAEAVSVTDAPQETETADTEYTCTLSVRCDTILNNMDSLAEDKAAIVPGDGVIFAPRKVNFSEGESVFDVLLREMQKNKIHLEFKQTPAYNSVYIEGIGNLYEFDCGGLSGWMYRVNGCFPNYGCSKHQLKDKDTVEWIYTCDLGADIGGAQSSGQW